MRAGPKGTGARHRLKIRPWQREIIAGVLDEPGPRQALVSIPAGNGKSSLAAALGLYGLLGDRVEGAQVLVVASDERQAWIIYTTAARMVELDEAMAARAGKRDRSLLLAIPTPPRAGQDDSVMRRLVDHGREGGDPSFFFREYAAPAGCALDEEQAWAIANPALDDFLHRDALRATLPPKMREAAFRRYRLGQWVTVEDAWLPYGAWQACSVPVGTIEDGAEVVIALDGSFSRDCTALVLATVEPRPHVHLYRLWEAPDGARDRRVPVIQVEDAIRAACLRWRVLEVAADPYRWQRSLEVLDGDGLPVYEFFQNAARMGPATARAYQLIVDGELTHDGNPALARHVANAILKADSRGARLAKEHKDSKRRIDAAVAGGASRRRAGRHGARYLRLLRADAHSAAKLSPADSFPSWGQGKGIRTRGHHGGLVTRGGRIGDQLGGPEYAFRVPVHGATYPSGEARAGGSRRGGQAGSRPHWWTGD